MTKTELYAEYGSYHTDPRNRYCHSVGIPLIVFGVLAMLASVRLGPVDLAVPIAVLVLIYYATISPRGALISLAIFAILYGAIVWFHVGWLAGLLMFVIGWAFQLVGHRMEGNKPKFLENLTYLAIGPLYFFEESLDGVLPRVR